MDDAFDCFLLNQPVEHLLFKSTNLSQTLVIMCDHLKVLLQDFVLSLEDADSEVILAIFPCM